MNPVRADERRFIMTLLEAIEQRHAVRKYLDRQLIEEAVRGLRAVIDTVNAESGLHIQLVLNEPKAFRSGLIRYGGFSNANNYIAMVGPKGEKLDETCGYYGERIVLEAQRLGLNTCWVGFKVGKVPDAYEILPGEDTALVIAVGYGANPGAPHRSKKPEQVSNLTADSPEWFRQGVKYALLAPTAINQQRFRLVLKEGSRVLAEKKRGPFSGVDLGIVKLHFALGAGTDNFEWE